MGRGVPPTFQVQVLGTVDALAGGRLVHFQCVRVAVVPTDCHIVPLVVIESPVTFALDEVGPIAKVKDIVNVPAEQEETHEEKTEETVGIVFLLHLVFVAVISQRPAHVLNKDVLFSCIVSYLAANQSCQNKVQK